MKAIKMILLGALSVSAATAFADAPKVEITSFAFAGSQTRAAELCGKVTGASAIPAMVRVAVDPKSKHPAIYNLVAGVDGSFCGTVVTYTGTADASLWTAPAVMASATATAVSDLADK